MTAGGWDAAARAGRYEDGLREVRRMIGCGYSLGALTSEINEILGDDVPRPLRADDFAPQTSGSSEIEMVSKPTGYNPLAEELENVARGWE